MEKSFQVAGDPGLAVVRAADSLGWQGGVFTEFDVFSDVVSYAVIVLPMWITKHKGVFRQEDSIQHANKRDLLTLHTTPFSKRL